MNRAALRYIGKILLNAGQPRLPAVLTNRAQLFIEPTEGDDCKSFVHGKPDGTGPCYSDGHYACRECVKMSAESPRWTGATEVNDDLLHR